MSTGRVAALVRRIAFIVVAGAVTGCSASTSQTTAGSDDYRYWSKTDFEAYKDVTVYDFLHRQGGVHIRSFQGADVAYVRGRQRPAALFLNGKQLGFQAQGSMDKEGIDEIYVPSLAAVDEIPLSRVDSIRITRVDEKMQTKGLQTGLQLRQDAILIFTG